MIVAERTTADGFHVSIYSDGAIVGAGAVILAPKLPARCLWQAVQSICSWDRAELPALVSHARKLAARKSEPEAGDFIRGVAMTPPPAPKTKVICDRWMQDGKFCHRDRRVPIGYRAPSVVHAKGEV